jgi:hypothetical protein
MPGFRELVIQILRATDIAPNTLSRGAPGREYKVRVALSRPPKEAQGGFIVSNKQRPPAGRKIGSGRLKGGCAACKKKKAQRR